jgi:hypothetical protein
MVPRRLHPIGRKMTIALRSYLVLVFLANLAGMATRSADLSTMLAEYPRLDPGLVAALYAAGLASLVAVVLIWRWNRVGVYVVVVAYAVMLLVNVYYQAPLAHTLLGPIGLAILLGLVWGARKRFRLPHRALRES